MPRGYRFRNWQQGSTSTERRCERLLGVRVIRAEPRNIHNSYEVRRHVSMPTAYPLARYQCSWKSAKTPFVQLLWRTAALSVPVDGALPDGKDSDETLVRPKSLAVDESSDP